MKYHYLFKAIQRGRMSLFLFLGVMLSALLPASAQCTSCTITITGPDAGTYTITTGQKLCVTATGSFSGNITLNGGTICNQGNFAPVSFNYSGGVIDNYGTLVKPGNMIMNGAGDDITNFPGATFSVGNNVIMSNAGASIINSGGFTAGGNYIKSNGTLTNSGTFGCSNFSHNGGTANNNSSGVINCNNLNVNGGTFVNNLSAVINVSNNFNNAGSSTSCAGKITMTNNFFNSGIFFLNNGGLVSCKNFTNSGTINGPGPGAGCGSIKVSLVSTNSVTGVINGYADICDATPPTTPVKIDINLGTVAPTVTYCVCCVLSTASISGPSEAYAGIPITLTANPAGSAYLWSNGSTTQSITVLVSANTTFTVTISYTNGCTLNASKAVTAKAVPFFCTLKKKLDASYFRTEEGQLFLKYEGEYNTGNLQYKIFDKNNVVVVSNTINPFVINSTAKNYGDNRYKFDFRCLLAPNECFILEVTNEKNEVRKLRFKMGNYTSIPCL